MFAVIATGGKQYKVSAKDKVKVEKLAAEEGKEVVFDQVLLTGEEDGSKLEIGTPTLKGVQVKAKVLAQGRAKKVVIEKFHSKVRYHKTYGHRQPFTEVEILSIA